MKPPPFRYYDPQTADEAVGLLASLENAKLLAGGQSLMPMLNMRFVQPDHVIDLNRVPELAFIREEAGRIRIGAMTRQRDLEFSPLVAERLPLIGAGLHHVGHRQTRNRGTIGGSLCHLDPAAELVTVAMTLDAEIVARGPQGERRLAMAEFPLGFMTPALELDEMLVAIDIPVPPAGHGAGFVEMARRHGDFAIVSAAATIELDGAGRIARAVLVLGGVDVSPLRMGEVEEALAGQAPSAAIFADHCRLCGAVEAMDDALVSGTYRRRIAPVMARRALEQAARHAMAKVAA
ncbi:xanthine dehydrogenase family protein subunit M [Ancylobacter sp. MQZ15Z-1]|uniref:Xanthine dehydrogenase family protein subunit M n=1 Tax=Ancylobacter mangrovi TaxID=2972472 RepID=A0A9X2T2U9_9HYPH|nr:xanthine dehydrogenase family protein subunit M [Ancylobacter mangrovi]MCS0496565.1 xanthine dehydrogenase family protein subunit M [Ancylobacter mangrovi]